MRYLEKKIVDNRVASDTIQTQLEAPIPVAVKLGAASDKALPNKVIPIIIEIEPVIVGGNNFSTD